MSTTPFDPDAAAQPGSGLFGLPHSAEDSDVHVLAAPFDATTSYRPGTRRGPRAIAAASHQIDLYDRLFGHPYRQGIHLQENPNIAKWNREARKLAAPIIAAGGYLEPDDIAGQEALKRVDALGEKLRVATYDFAKDCLAGERIPVILGGDHSVPLGAIQACAEAHPGLGILHIDAHADLRIAFEGFRFSHASILHNVLETCDISSLVQIGLRDIGDQEAQRTQNDARIHAIFDDEWDVARRQLGGIDALIESAVAKLPETLYITWDIDGLDPTLCPSTGTPVPGGLLWGEAMALLLALKAAGKRIVGFDLCEVNPGPNGDKKGEGWDAIVGARLLYRLCGLALTSP